MRRRSWCLRSKDLLHQGHPDGRTGGLRWIDDKTSFDIEIFILNKDTCWLFGYILVVQNMKMGRKSYQPGFMYIISIEGILCKTDLNFG